MKTLAIQKESLIPRYAQLKDILRQWIREKYTAGDRIPSERELSRMFSISRFTVVRAIKELEYEGLLYSDHGRGTFVTAASSGSERMNFQVIQKVGRGVSAEPSEKRLTQRVRPTYGNKYNSRPDSITAPSNLIIHIIIPLSIILEDKDRDVFVHKSEYLGIKHACEKEGMHYSLHDAVGPGNGAHLINELVGGAVIFVGNWGKIAQKLVPKLRSRGIPWCGIGSGLEQVFPGNCIYADLRQGAVLALEHLLKLGYKNIGYCYETAVKSDPRMLAFKEYISRRRIQTHELLPVNFTMEMNPLEIKQCAYLAARARFKQAKLPQAYFCQNDLLALGILEAAKEKGIKVPEDLAIVGFDDRPEARESAPTLTTVRVPFEEMGSDAVRQMKKCLETGKTSFSSIKFSCKLVTRNSCKGI